jgi:serine/threonine-protein kinase
VGNGAFASSAGADEARASEPQSLSLPAQEHLGKFQLIARLGKGGMGEVVLAFSTGEEGFKKLVVIKRLHARFSEDARMRELFLQEARLAARLNHPNVVQTYEVGVQDGAMVMSMEYLEGQPVSRLSHTWSQPANPRIVARIVSDALLGLQYAHELRDFDGQPLEIVHRDVSPHNLFVTYDGVVKVLDFGIAKAANQSSGTESGVLKGKIAYMSPEQLTRGETIDRRSDIFCAGLVLWELLCGRKLLSKGSMQQTFYALLNEATPRPSSIVAGVPRKLDEIVLRALEKDPANRYPTAHEMREALEAYLASSGPPVRQEDLGHLVTGAFSKERQSVQDQIREMIPRIDEETSSRSLPVLNDNKSEGSLGSQQSRLVAIDVSLEAMTSNVRRKWIALAAGLVVVVGLGTVAVLGQRPASAVPPPTAGAPRDLPPPSPVSQPVPTDPATTNPDVSGSPLGAASSARRKLPEPTSVRNAVAQGATTAAQTASTTSLTIPNAPAAASAAAIATATPQALAPSEGMPGKRKFRKEL